MEVFAFKEWEDVLLKIQKERGVVLSLGATDTGKSTLTKFLISHLCLAGKKVAFVDSDVGQSFLGPPTTIGLALFTSPPDWQSVPPLEIFFVGSTTPEGHILTHLKGVTTMVDKASAQGAEVIMVDTTGYISGEGGKELKRKKIELLQPRLVIALQRAGELEGILELTREHSPCQILRLAVSNRVRLRSYEERKTYRERKFQEYFEGSTTHAFSTDRIRLEGGVTDSGGRCIPLEQALSIRGLLVGLKDIREETLAVGMIERHDEGKRLLRLLTPLKSLEKLKTLQLSSLKLTPFGKEENL